jgi:hypothetical protein
MAVPRKGHVFWGCMELDPRSGTKVVFESRLGRNILTCKHIDGSDRFTCPDRFKLC